MAEQDVRRKVTPEMEQAWSEFDPVIPNVPSSDLRDAVLMRQAFYSGWLARTLTPDAVNADKAVGSSTILRRLRQPSFGTETSERNLMNAAADEIERLQAHLTPAPDKALMPEAAVGELLKKAAQIAGDVYWNLPMPKHWDRDKQQYVEWCSGQSAFVREKILALTPTPVEEPTGECPSCAGRGTIETGEMENGPAGIGFETADCADCHGTGMEEQ